MIDNRDFETRHNWHRKAGDGKLKMFASFLEKNINNAYTTYTT